jgi:hypothetical protein
MGLEVDWGSFGEAMQTQNESVKVRRELIETPINEVHVMGGERYGFAGNSKFNEQARQERQMNGYPLRSFLATGGPLVLPGKRGDPLLATQGTMGHSVFIRNSADMGLSTSSFSEPLHDALDTNALSMGRSGAEAMSEAIQNPFQRLQFMLNMHESNASIQNNQEEHQNIKAYNQQGNIKESLAKEEQRMRTEKINYDRQRQREARMAAGDGEGGIGAVRGNVQGENDRPGNAFLQEIESFNQLANIQQTATKKEAATSLKGVMLPKKLPSSPYMKPVTSLSGIRKNLDSDAFNVPKSVEKAVFETALVENEQKQTLPGLFMFPKEGFAPSPGNPLKGRLEIGEGEGSNRSNQAMGFAQRQGAEARKIAGGKPAPAFKKSGTMTELRAQQEAGSIGVGSVNVGDYQAPNL